ncbi:transposase [Streptomyces sp. enrichment culture]|uniref:transposase n=1 Tax=Streptomyces sp. enrichment culture TaxID=1795815 RepID=UPI003F576442
MASKTVESVLFPGIDVRVERVRYSSDVLVVEAVSTTHPGRCPDCRKQAMRVHSTYQRALGERPLGSRRVMVRLRGHRYFCDRKSCSRKAFVEQVPGLPERHGRPSTGLTGWLRSIAIELGGRPAARMCHRLRLTAGRTRLLRLLTAPTVPDRAPRVLGVDEFAFRKGCTYGTVLVDVEAGRGVDVLPERTSETFAAWLTEHPGAEIICRDRATAYATAVKEAPPTPSRSLIAGTCCRDGRPLPAVNSFVCPTWGIVSGSKRLQSSSGNWWLKTTRQSEKRSSTWRRCVAIFMPSGNVTATRSLLADLPRP